MDAWEVYKDELELFGSALVRFSSYVHQLSTTKVHVSGHMT